MILRVLILSLCTITLYATDYRSNMIDIDKNNGYIVYKKGTKTAVTGLLKTYYDDNKTLREIIPLKDGSIDGLYKAYYKSGALKSTIEYAKSRRDGKQTEFYENKQKSYEAQMHHGKREGLVKAWYKNAQLSYAIKYHNDKATGLVKVYDKNGTVSFIDEYKDGVLTKQIQPKKPDNIQLQTRALATYGSGKDIYYLFVSPLCPHCHDFLSTIETYKKDVTFYIYVIPLNAKNKEERHILDLIYREPFATNRLKTLFSFENGTLDINKTISPEETYKDNTEIAKAQQIQAVMGIRDVPTLIDTKGFRYNVNQFAEKVKQTK